jgi:hypothetical protein
MGLEFLQEHSARRSEGSFADFSSGSSSDALPNNEAMPQDGDADNFPSEKDDKESKIERGYEEAPALWTARDVSSAAPPADWPERPRRFVDGKDVGRTVAWILSPQGMPVPLRLSQVGAIALASEPGPDGWHLAREASRVETVVSFMADLFPWAEVESFAAALQARGFRLLFAPHPKPEDEPRDLENAQNSAKKRTNEEMFRLERAVMTPGEGAAAVPTIGDGRLEDKAWAYAPDAPVIGVVKTHARWDFLDARGWSIVYNLRPFERTPIFGLKTASVDALTWYVGLHRERHCGPMDGVVRVEINRAYFQDTLGGDYAHVDRLTHWLCQARTRDHGYGRAAITLYPIQRAEDMLRAQFSPLDRVETDFYRLTGL